MTLAFAALLIGVALIYAGVKGLSVRRVLIGDNTVKAQNKTLAQAAATPS